jgi:peptidoglycan/LPS O-acetylase OafA/YrhL
MLADLAATIVLASASWRVLEQPVRRWLVAQSEQRERSVAGVMDKG